MSHTPGPWRLIHTDGDPLGVFHPTISGVAIAMFKEPPYAPLNGFVTDVEEQITNASLIASSPELLDSLKALVAAVEAGEAQPGKLGWAVETAKALITKVEHP